MQLNFLHTADWQLGKPFASVADDAKRFRLQEQRVATIRGLAGLVAESGAAFVLVAGDLFDSPHVTKPTVSAACAAIGALNVPVLAIPGNHDHGGGGSIWEQEFFLREQQQLAPNLRVLLTPGPVLLESAIVFPAPLLRRHDPGDPTAWIRHAALDPALPADLPRIVLAHGSIQGFDSRAGDDDDLNAPVNWLDLAALPPDAIDYIALGDWHGTKQVGPKAWYCGTPETDRFPKGGDHDPGNILKVTIARGAPPVVGKIPTSRFRWLDCAFRFADDASLAVLATRLGEMTGATPGECLLLLTLEGTLGIEAAAGLESLLESWQSRLIRLKLDHQVTIAPSADEIAALTRRAEDPLIAAVATELVGRCQTDGDDAVLAPIALRELHAALR